MEISERQLEIIETAGRILSVSGLSGLTTKNLAKEIGFSEAALYRHFPSKEDIILGLLDYLRTNMDERLEKVFIPHADPKENLIALFESQFSFFSKNPHYVVAVFSDGLMEGSDKINQAILQLMQVKMKYLMPIVMQGQQKGTFTQAITNEELVHIIMGSFRLQMFKWKISNFKFDINRQGRNMLEALLTLIKQ
ncbi:transcriptional regulator, TetR family [Aquiflexum balticum DSM 16537]|uniref:Transcriptional regulator, TetR family n=1 Tax=Aquiflexum balticum DSM 16537 TaxID=758820 RepID=A0A1W2HAV1_9BACT|nr:TetR/AcrR family transcriptional regulator [Aquiflexum balticum]SMD46020.1 transcriptional regulator, TetR family [Aquiflexum balticum DSM 16537]